MKTFRFIATAVAILATLAGKATEINFSYADPTAEKKYLTTGKLETYDVAILIDDAEFIGKEISSVNIPFIKSDNVTDVKVWVTKQLKLDGSKNVADTYEADVTAGRTISYTFPTPILIPEGGIYIGYSFKILAHDDETSMPVITRVGRNKNGLFIHTQKQYLKWTDVSSSRRMVSDMSVVIAGDFNEVDMTAEIDENEINIVKSDETVNIPLTITNYGGYTVSSIDLAYSFSDGAPQSKKIVFDPAMKTRYGMPCHINVELPNLTSIGDNNLKVKVEAVNGRDNANTRAEASCVVSAFSSLPKKTPLFEEYTGLWCGYCPRGLAALDYMSRLHEGEFIGVSFHKDDKIAVTGYFPVPDSTSMELPVAYMDRDWEMDPYYGRYDGNGLEKDWKERCSMFTPAEISVTAALNASNPSIVDINADVYFVKKIKNDCQLFYYLIADGIHSPSWKQTNAFSGEDPSWYFMPEMRKFCEGERKIPDLVFNDVVVLLSDPYGVQGSLPVAGDIATETTYSHKYTFDTTIETSSKEGNPSELIAMADRLRVVVGLRDTATGHVLNAAQCVVEGFNAISAPESEAADIVSTEYYDMAGRRVDNPANGLYIVRQMKSDGTASISKIAIR